MKRGQFLASLAALAVAPFVKLDAPKKPIPMPMPKVNRFAYDLGSVPRGMTAKEVFELYNETGVLVYQGRNGVQIIEGEVELREISDGKV